MTTHFDIDDNGRQRGLDWTRHGGLENPFRPVVDDETPLSTSLRAARAAKKEKAAR